MRLLAPYESFLLSNASQITSVESSLRSLTWFLPGRFKDSELAAEVLYTSLNLIGLYHDQVLRQLLVGGGAGDDLGGSLEAQRRRRAIQNQHQRLRHANDDVKQASATTAPALIEHTPTQHARYTHHWADRSKAYQRIARLLVVIGYTELMAEMFSRRKLGEKRTWDVILGVEALKATLRLALMHLTQGRPTVQPPIPEREVDPTLLEEQALKDAAAVGASRTAAAAAATTTDATDDRAGGRASRLRTSAMSSSAELRALEDDESWRGARSGLKRATLAALRRRQNPELAAAAAAKRAAKLADAGAGAGARGAASPSASTSSLRGKPHPLAASRELKPTLPGSKDDEVTSLRATDEGDEAVAASQAATASSASASASADGGSASSDSDDSDSDETLVDPPISEREINEYLLSRVLRPTDVGGAQTLVRPLQGYVGRAAELLWILRPLLYVLALRHYGRKHRTPFLLSLGIEYLARRLRQRSFDPPLSSDAHARGGGGSAMATLLASMMGAGGGGGAAMALASAALGFGGGGSARDKARRPVSEVERAEWARRDSAFWWYLLRGPLWDQWTRPKLLGLASATENRPLLGILGGIVRDYLPLVDEYYYYSAT